VSEEEEEEENVQVVLLDCPKG